VNRAIVILLFASAPALADLKPATVKAFDAYMERAAREMADRAAPGQAFLWSASSGSRMQSLQSKGIVVSPTGKEPVTDVPDGMVHDWTGAIFIPGAKVEHALQVLRDVNNHKRIYAPETVDSKLLSGDGLSFRSSMRTYKKQVLEVVLDYEFETTYRQVAPGRWQGVIRSTRIVEVEDYGKANETQKPPGAGHGFLWRLNSWWNLEEVNGGLVMELRSVSLTRDIPMVLSWIIKPIVTNFPKEQLESTLGKTRMAVAAAARQGAAR
jgi:hypothetical protein